jgi:hypothetical protein
VRPEPPRCERTRDGLRCALDAGHTGRCVYRARARMNVRRLADECCEQSPDGPGRLVDELEDDSDED